MESAETKGMLQDVVAKLKMKRDGLQKALTQAEVEIRAVETTLNLISQNGSPPDHLSAMATESAYDFKNKTQRECLVEIAERNGGILKVSEAKRILTIAGRLKKTRNAWGSVHTTLARAKEFEKVATGTFRLTTKGTAFKPQDKFELSDPASNVIGKAQ